MIEPKKREIITMIRCENEDCGGVCFADELEQSDWKCPYCGKPISKPDRLLMGEGEELFKKVLVRHVMIWFFFCHNPFSLAFPAHRDKGING